MGWLDRMKKNVFPDYPIEDISNGSYFQMKNILNHIVNSIPSGLSFNHSRNGYIFIVSRSGQKPHNPSESN